MLRPAEVAKVLLTAACILSAACILNNPNFDSLASNSASQSGSESDPSATLPDSLSESDVSGDAGSGTSTGTGASTSPTSEGSSTGAESSTGAGLCGDGVVDDDEECDDGNLAAGDDCSPLCHTPPTGIELIPDGETASVGDGPFGHTAICAEQGALHRMSGKHNGPNNGLRICALVAYCAALELQPDLSVNTPNIAALGSIQGTCEDTQTWNRPCPPGELIVGYGGRTDQGLSQLVVRCAPVQVSENADGFVIGTGPAANLPGVGSMGGDEFGPHDCPQGSVATGALGAVPESVAGFKLRCHELALTYG